MVEKKLHIVWSWRSKRFEHLEDEEVRAKMHEAQKILDEALAKPDADPEEIRALTREKNRYYFELERRRAL